MKTIVSYKTETTGFPLYGEPSEDKRQPHLTRLSAIKYDQDSGKLIAKFDVYICPGDWVISEEIENLVGITNEYATEHGIFEDEAINQFINFCEGSFLITSSKSFNKRIVRIALKRYCDPLACDKWKNNVLHDCVISLAKKDQGKKKLTMMEAAHAYHLDYEKGNSMSDAKAAADIYFLLHVE